MKSRLLWQEHDWPVEITFNRLPERKHIPLDANVIWDLIERGTHRGTHFTHYPDPHLPGEILLRGLKEGA